MIYTTFFKILLLFVYCILFYNILHNTCSLLFCVKNRVPKKGLLESLSFAATK